MKAPKSLNIIGILPARGGSVRIPLKNIRFLGKKPLIAYMIKAALASKYLRRVIVSTDHPAIKNVALRYGAESPFKRPEEISGGCPSILVTRHAVRFIEKEEGDRLDAVVTLQPTSPFCRAEDIDNCVELLLKARGAVSVFSAVDVSQRPEWMFRLKNGNRVEPYISGVIGEKRVLRQLLSRVVIPNGAVYVMRRSSLFNESSLISGKSLAYMMPLERSMDIDDEIDLSFAEFLMGERSKKCRR